MVVRKKDFEALRLHMRQRFARLSGFSQLSFDEAFVLAEQYVDTWATTIGWFQAFQGESLTFHSAMGAFLWNNRRREYFFSIQGGAQMGLPVEATCPSLRVALHATNLKRAAWNSTEVSYVSEARGIMAAGLCGAAATHSRLSPADALLCAGAAYQASDLMARADDVGHAWTARESEHCERRSLARLRADYQTFLLRTRSYRPSLTLLRWALAGNATRAYSWEARGDRNRLDVFDGQA